MKMTKLLATGMALSLLASPLLGQDAPEDPRTTYQVTFLKFTRDADDEEWMKMMDEHFNKARRTAGLPLPTVHWMSTGPWNVMIVTQMPGGMASLDSHNPAAGAAYRKALLAQEGSEEKVRELNAKSNAMVADSERFFTHTHP